MAINATTVYRVRAGSNNVNGGGFDSSISGTLATTLNGAITNSALTLVVASSTGFPASGSFYAQLGAAGAETTAGNNEIVQVTAVVGTTWTIVRAQLGTTAQAFASGVAVTNDLSRCNTAAFSGSIASSTASTTFTDAAGAFNATVVGNTLWLASGTGTTVSAYCVTGYTNATTITLDRASGTYTAAGVWKIGGAWADYRTNLNATYMVPGYTQYVRGSGTNSPNPASPDYTFATATLAAGSNAQGFSRVLSEYGRACLKGSTNTIFTLGVNVSVSGFYFCGAATGSTAAVISGSTSFLYDNVFDQNSFDQSLLNTAGASTSVYGNEFFNSGSAPAAANAAIVTGSTTFVRWNNFHNLTAGAINNASTIIDITNNIFSNCGADTVTISGSGNASTLVGNTFDAGIGHGVIFSSAAQSILQAKILNNIFSNFNQASKYAINGSVNTTAINDREKGLIDYNTFYNNTANYNAITAGANDTQLSADPYVSQSTQDYRLATALLNGVGYPNTAYPQHGSGKSTSDRSYITPGAINPMPRGAQIVS